MYKRRDGQREPDGYVYIIKGGRKKEHVSGDFLGTYGLYEEWGRGTV